MKMISDNWGIVSAIGTALIGFGVLQAEVSANAEAVEQIPDIRTQQAVQGQDIKDIKRQIRKAEKADDRKLDAIMEALKDLGADSIPGAPITTGENN